MPSYNYNGRLVRSGRKVEENFIEISYLYYIVKKKDWINEENNNNFNKFGVYKFDG